MFTFKKCFSKEGIEFSDLYEIEPKVFGDGRGYFFESYNERDFFSAGIKMRFVQDNQSFSRKGVLRGLHFQKNHAQAKLVRAVSGSVFDVAVDLRRGSKTFGKWHAVVLDSKKQNQFFIPQGFAHGFLVLSEEAIFAYKCTDFYDPSGEGGILWSDEKIAIDFPKIDADFILSEKDKKLSAFDFNAKYFDASGKWIGE